MIRIDGSPIAPQADAGALAQQGAQARTGTLGGEQVMVKDASSMLADGAEELSLHHSEKVEAKEFAEREVESDKPVEMMLIQDINAYLDAAKQFEDPEQLAQLAKRMQMSQENPRELARRESREPADQYVLLQFALQDAQKGGAGEEVIERLQEAIADLEMEAGPQIRAGLNSIGAASEFGKTREEVAAFQSTYRDVVLGDNSLSQTLKLALERMGGGDLQRGLQGLIKGLGADLAAARPSTDPTRMQALVQDLYQLEVAATVLEGCNDLSVSLREKHGSGGVKPDELMKELVAVTGERWVGANRFTSLADRFSLTDVGAQIAFHSGTKAMMREMPVKVFPDPETRQSVLDASQGALDQAIEREEE